MNFRNAFLWVCLIFSLNVNSQTVSLSPNQTANQLATKLVGKGILLPGTGISLNCNAQANGTFINVNPTPNLSLAIDTGIILCTGRVLTVAGDTGINANRAAQASKNWSNTTTDAQITSIAGTTAVQRDLCFLQFNFIPQGDTAYIDYVFASEEYPEYGCSQYVDAFGIFVSPPSSTTFTNYAKVPGTNVNVSTNSINDTMKQTGASNFVTYCQSLGSGAPFIQHYTGNLVNNHIVYDGMTKILRATIPVSSFQTHTMKIAIADIADGFFDSGIFLKQFSFTSKIKLEITERRGTNGVLTADTINLIEGCSPGVVKFSRVATASPITVNASFSGTASSGDYSASSTFTIPAGSNNFFYTIQAILDTMKEIPENLRIVFSVPSINYSDTVRIIIRDFAHGINIFGGKRDTAICSGGALRLGYTNTNTIYNLNWSPAARLNCTSCIDPTYTAPNVTTFTVDTVKLRISTVGCPAVDTPIIVRIHPFPSLSLNPNLAYCKGDSAQLLVTPTPTGAYTYSWTPAIALSSTTIANPIAKPVSNQAYKVIVSTAAGCKDSASTLVRVSSIRDEIDSITVTKTTCGLSNGNITIKPKTGTSANPPYQYSVNGGSTFVSSNVFNGLAVGTYNLAVKNLAGCRFDTTITITAGSGAPSATIKIDSTTCGLINGKIRILTKSGIKPITQTWRLGATILSTDTFINNRPSGIYSLSVQDSLGCVVQYTINIGPSTPSTASFTFTQPRCGLNNGSISATPTSGISPYKFLWSTGDTSSIISSKGSGTYVHTLTDAKGCTKKDTLTLNTSTGINVSKSNMRSTCGLANGSATVSITGGGNPPYIYSWSNGIVTASTSSNSHMISGLVKGWYKFTIQDNNSCLKIDSIYVDATPQVSLSIQKTNTNCGLANGAITVHVVSGKSPYTYVWSGGATTATRTGLVAGFYTVTVTDSNNCTAASGITLTNNSLPISSNILVHPTCGLNNGRITATVSGGRPKIKYLWSTGDSLSAIRNVAPGIYTLTVTDSFGCQYIKRDTLKAIPVISYTDSIVQPLCRSALGSIYLKNIIGTPPITFTWSNGTSNSSLENKLPGIYSVMVRDSNNCKLSRSFILNPKSNPKLTLNVRHAVCRDTLGFISTSVDSGRAPYKYLWNTGDTLSTITNRPKGFYSLVITDSLGCKDSMADSILRKPPMTYSDSFVIAKCNQNNGRIHIYNAAGYAPFSYKWSHNDTVTRSFLRDLPAGIYLLTITDRNGCEVYDTFDLNSNGAIMLTATMKRSKCRDSTGSISISIFNGTPPYTITWSNGDRGLLADSLKHGTYGLFVRDSLGCIYADSIKVKDSTNMQVQFDVINTRCDINTGKLTASAIIAHSPYRYQWQRFPRDSFATIDTLGIGNYELRVTDSMGCKYDTSATIFFTHYPVIEDSIVIETCAGGNGEVHIKIDSVIHPITIRWDNVIDSVYKKTGLRGPVWYNVTVIDSQNCQGTISLYLPENSTRLPNYMKTDPPCGRNLGTLEVVGEKIASVVWSPGGKTTKKIDSLAPGPFSATVTDSNGCVFVLRDTLRYTTPPLTSYWVDRPNCGQFDGKIEASVLTSTGGLRYKYRKLPGGFSADSATFGIFELRDLDSGRYIVHVIDGFECTTIDTLILKDSSAQKINLITDNAKCINSTGKVKANIVGGKLPYIIQWYDFSSADTIVNLASGTYKITVTDSRNCIVEDSAEVKFLLPPSLYMQGENSLCGNGKGKITSTISFGVPPLTYQWQSSSVTIKDRQNLNNGTYKLIVTDSLGCKDSGSIYISAQPPLLVNLTRAPAFCNFNNGTATAVVTSGTPPYIPVWDGWITSLNLINADSGKKIIHIIDSNNCEFKDSIYIPRITKQTISTIVTNDNCTYKNGKIQTTVSGGKAPLIYAWSHNASLNNATALNLGAGVYTVSVTDSLGCLVTDVKTITDSAGPITSLIITNATCGFNNGTILANVSSIKPPITYYWNNVLGTNTINSVNGGRYICKVVDARGCIKLDTANLDTVKALSGSFIKRNASCNINNGYIKAVVTGGSGAKTYTWGHTANPNDSVGNLSPGKYKVTVSDVGGCTWVDSIVITQQGNPSISLVRYNATCQQPNGSIKAKVTNSISALNFNWSNNQKTDSAFGLVPGLHTVTVSDGVGCNVTSSIVVGNIGMDSIRLNVFHPRCLVNNGRIKAIAVNSSGNVTYNWSTSATIDSIHPLAPGSYTITVSDSLCTYTKTTSLVMGTIPKISLVKQDATCNINNGIIVSSVTQGTPPMSYLWSNSMVPASLYGVDSGTYRVTVTDNYGCRDSNTIYVGRTQGLNFSFNLEKSKCGLSNGSLSVNVTGGQPGYNLLWNTGATTSALTNRVAGKYWVTARDANNCVRTDTVTLEDRKKPVIIDNKLQAVCGMANGAIMISIQDGTSPFRYSWSTGDTTKDMDSLAVGIYRLTVTDSIGCTDLKNIDIDPGTPPYLNPDSTFSIKSTCGLKNGKMQALLMRGVDPIKYTWSTGDTGKYVSNILFGKHYLTVVDGRQCVVVDSLEVTTTTIPKIRLDSTDAYCLKANGQISSTITNGTPPFNYIWSHGATTQNAATVFSGTYTLTVADIHNCRDSATSRVIEELNQVRSSYDTFRLNCHNDFSGRVIFHATGGQIPYQYSIQTTSNDSIFSGLGAGKYKFAVTDNKGCIYTDSFIINQPDTIRLVFDSIKPLTCHNRNDAMLQVSASGSNGGFTYLWTPSNQTTPKATMLGDNTHRVVATDSKGCSKPLQHTFINPAQIELKSTRTHNLCFGESKGAIKLDAKNGVRPYTFVWSNGQQVQSLNQLSNGNYSCTLTDNVGCMIVKHDTIQSPTRIIPGVAIPRHLVCGEEPDGEIEVAQFDGGVKPFSFSINNGATYTMLNKFNELTPGSYKIYIRDKNGCMDSLETTINGIAPFNISTYPKDTTVTLGESVALGFAVSPGDPSRINSVLWTESEGLNCTDCHSPIATTYVSKLYRVQVKYSGKCFVTDTVRIKVLDDNDLYIPNSFAPSASNPENRTFRVYANKVMKAEVMIFNRWGEKMYETEEGHLTGWDGSYLGEPAPMAVYIYYVSVTYLGGRKVIRKGDVTLVR
jgi:gliding motility-associated-like protein